MRFTVRRRLTLTRPQLDDVSRLAPQISLSTAAQAVFERLGSSLGLSRGEARDLALHLLRERRLRLDPALSDVSAHALLSSLADPSHADMIVLDDLRGRGPFRSRADLIAALRRTVFAFTGADARPTALHQCAEALVAAGIVRPGTASRQRRPRSDQLDLDFLCD